MQNFFSGRNLTAVCLAVFFLMLTRPTAIADDDTTETPVRAIRKSQCVTLVQGAFNVKSMKQLVADISEDFPNFESDMLSEVTSSFKETDAVNGQSFGQSFGLVLPEMGYFVSIALPLNASEVLDDADYELGEDEQGRSTIDGHPVVKSDRYFGFTMAETSDDSVPIDGGLELAKDLIRYVEKNENRLISIQSAPAKIGRSALSKTILGFRTALGTAAQKFDDETDLEYSWRKIADGHQARLVELLFRDVEYCDFHVDSSESSYPFSFQLDFTCRKKSGLLTSLQDLHKRRNRALTWLHPSASAFANVSVALPKVLQEQLQVAGQRTAEAARAEGLSKTAVNQLQGVLSQSGNSGAVELLVQKIRFDSNSECFVALMPQDSMSNLHPEVVHLVSSVEDETAVREIEGWSVYSADGLFGEGVLPEDWTTCVFSTDSAIAFMMMKDDDAEQTFDFLEELVSRDFAPADAGAAFARSLFAAEFSLTDVFAVTGLSVGALLPANTELSESGRLESLDNDGVRATLSLNGNQLSLKFQFEPKAVALGIQAAIMLVELASSVL